MNGVTIIVMAKECVPGRVKTRLHPPFSLEDAAGIASACLDDTLAAVAGIDARRLLCVQGSLDPIPGFEQMPQSTGDLDERIADALDRVDGPVLLIGMDTPQLDPALLGAVARRWPLGVDAWFGPAADGGFWLLGLRGVDELRGAVGSGARGDLVRGVAMSRDDTGAVQRARLTAAGLSVADLPELTDVDDVDSLRTVAEELSPASALARRLAAHHRDIVPAASGADRIEAVR
ncbi:DUF2064 domain-containing protein [Microbacterium sp. CIAB417]|uniref:TIGR04282 family arsenosugar biosynthesis glycosyltransferase n=1 Tax=Microbacterium sp. CIAB417 TaxID=2860287 RepID=UPI001FAD2D11|nr:DUF2064 domain-containing protein [Microbacterium sp. CIAB417]